MNNSSSYVTNPSLALFCQLEIDLNAWQKLTQMQYSHNSILSFQNDWKIWLTYCLEKNKSPLPASISSIVQFIEKQALLRKSSSIKRYIITISLVHRLHGLTDPTKHREIRFTLNRLYREKTGDATQATSFNFHHLNTLHCKFVTSLKLKDCRDLLIWTLSLEAMLKRSELAQLSYQSFDKIDDIYQLQLNDQIITLSEKATILLDKWFLLSKIKEGPLLRRINKHQQLGDNSMDHSSIYRVFRRAASELNLEHILTFSGQSPRVGASQDLSKKGMTIKEIQYQGRWKSPAMPAQYVGNKQASDEAFAKFKRKIEKD